MSGNIGANPNYISNILTKLGIDRPSGLTRVMDLASMHPQFLVWCLTFGAQFTYDGSYGTVNGSYNYSQNSQRLNYGIRGGILAHSEGVTLSQELGETIALVKAPGAAGLEIDNMRGAATDWRGYTVKTQLNPYDVDLPLYFQTPVIT